MPEPSRSQRAPLRARDRVLPLGDKTYIMAILNLTEDSFSGDGVGSNLDAAVRRAVTAEADGADIIDIGAESARADVPVRDAGEESELIGRAVERIAGECGLVISADTYKPPSLRLRCRQARTSSTTSVASSMARARRRPPRHMARRSSSTTRTSAQRSVRQSRPGMRTWSSSTLRSSASASRPHANKVSVKKRSSSTRGSRSESHTTKTSRCCGGSRSSLRLGVLCS